MLIQQCINAGVQVVLFSVVPLLWWLVTARKKQRFTEWIGMKKPEGGKALLGWTVVVFLACFLAGEVAVWVRGDVQAAESAYAGMGFGALPSVCVYAYIQTALSEEILFRGFLFKRLMAKLGFVAANVIQAVIFGALHLLMVWGHVGLVAGAVIVLYPMIPAVAFAVLNERKAGGSIWPGWFIHGTLNAVSACFALF